jgi:hypothetical protein
MLEWKARILMLLATMAVALDQLGIQFDNNWNW